MDGNKDSGSSNANEGVTEGMKRAGGWAAKGREDTNARTGVWWERERQGTRCG